MIESKKTVHVHNMAETEAYLSGDPVAVASVKIAGARTRLAVPMLKENELMAHSPWVAKKSVTFPNDRSHSSPISPRKRSSP